MESAIGDHSPEDAATSMLTVKQILLERLPSHSGTFSDFSDDHHRALESNQRFRKHVRDLWRRLDKLAWKHLPCTEAALLDDFRSQAQSGNVEHSFICAALRLHEAQQAVLNSFGDTKRSWSTMPYCVANRIEFELSAIGDNNAEGDLWPSAEVMKDMFAEVASMSWIKDIIAEALEEAGPPRFQASSAAKSSIGDNAQTRKTQSAKDNKNEQEENNKRVKNESRKPGRNPSRNSCESQKSIDGRPPPQGSAVGDRKPKGSAVGDRKQKEWMTETDLERVNFNEFFLPNSRLWEHLKVETNNPESVGGYSKPSHAFFQFRFEENPATQWRRLQAHNNGWTHSMKQILRNPDSVNLLLKDIKRRPVSQ